MGTQRKLQYVTVVYMRSLWRDRPRRRLRSQERPQTCMFSRANPPAGRPSFMRRRLFLASALAAPFLPRHAHADTIVVKMGVLKLIHSITPYFYEKFTPDGYRFEILSFESPTEGKNRSEERRVGKECRSRW